MMKALILKGYLSARLVLFVTAVVYGAAILAVLSACTTTAQPPAAQTVCLVKPWDNGAGPIANGFRMQELTAPQLRLLLTEYNATPPVSSLQTKQGFAFFHPANRSSVHFALVNDSCIDGLFETDTGYASQLLTSRGA